MSDSDPLDQAKNLTEAGQNEAATPIIEEAIRQNPTDARG
jgi:Flp pilus assembly protein TadD